MFLSGNNDATILPVLWLRLECSSRWKGLRANMTLHRPRSRGFAIEEICITSSLLPSGGQPLTFVHLSDLHVRAFREEHEQLIRLVNEREVDFVFVTGDIPGRKRNCGSAACRLIGALRSRYGVYACRGNWEAKRFARISFFERLMTQCGARTLINESEVVRTHAGRVMVSGVDDLLAGWPDFDSALVTEGPAADYGILLSHAPLAALLLTEHHRIQIVLSGHTHGGQIRVPWLWKRLLPACHAGFFDGLYRFRWGHLYVSRGVGTVGLPFRFRCPPEIAFFEVSAANRAVTSQSKDRGHSPRTAS